MSNQEHVFLDYLKSYRGYYTQYHNHKEQMAWLATVLYIGGCTAFLINRHIFTSLKPFLLFEKPILNFFSFCLVFSIVSFLFTWFICWQFNNRAFASHIGSSCDKLITGLLSEQGIPFSVELKHIKDLYCPKSLYDEYNEIKNRAVKQKSELISYIIMGLFFVLVKVKVLICVF